MVVFLVRDPLVTVAMDRVVAHEKVGEGGALAGRRSQFLRETIEKKVSVVAPSVALDSLWVLLYLRREFVLAQARADSAVSARFSDWILTCADLLGYLDHLLLHERHVALSAPPADATSTREVYSALAVLDLALDVFAPRPQTPSAGAVTAPSGVNLVTREGRRSPSALLQPATLGLLIRDFETLWCWTYLLLQVHKRHLAKRSLLTREDDTGALQKRLGTNTESKSGRHRPTRDRDGAKAVNSLPLDQFFHDYELLIPCELLAVCAAASGVAEAHDAASTSTSASSFRADLHLVGRWLSTIAAEASDPHTRAVRQEQAAMQQSHRPRRQEDQREARVESHHDSCARDHHGTATNSRAVVASLVLVPAVSPDNNPDRALKNRRVDVIDGAAMNYFYKQLASRSGSGGADGAGDGGHGAGGVPQRIHVDGASDILNEVQLSQNDVAYGRRRADEVEKAESFASFMRNASIGLDIHIMSLTGAGVGYYVGHVRGRSTETCILYAVVGLVVMMFVDATLLIIRLGRHDEGVVKQKQKSAKARARLGVTQKRQMDAAAGVAARLAAAAAGGVGGATGVSAATGDNADSTVPTQDGVAPENTKLKKD